MNFFNQRTTPPRDSSSSATPVGTPPSTPRERQAFTLLFVWCVLIFGPLIGLGRIFQVSEAREGVVINEMVQSDEYILPLRNGEIVPSKPVLFHWVGAVTALVRGEVDEVTLRLPSLLAAAGILLLVARFLAVARGLSAAYLGAFLLLTTYGFVRMMQDGRVDMLFCFFVVGAITQWLSAAVTAIRTARPLTAIAGREYWNVGIWCGLAALTKGPLGIALPLLVIGAIFVMEEGFAKSRNLIRAGWIAAVGIPAPWYIAAAVKQQGFVNRQLVFENFARVVGGEGITVKPPWFYIPHFLSQGAPWSIIFFIYMIFLVRGALAVRKGRAELNTFLPNDRIGRFVVLGGLVWCGVMLVLFSVSMGKRRGYLLPILPGMAIILAVRFTTTWERIAAGGRASRLGSLFRYEVFTWGVLMWLVVLTLTLAASLLGESTAHYLLRLWPEVELPILAVTDTIRDSRGILPAYFFAFAITSIIFWVYSFYRRDPKLAAAGIFLFFELVVILVSTGFLAVKGITHSYRDFALHVSSTVPTDIPLSFVKTVKDESFDGFFFYYKRHVKMIDPESVVTEPGLYLARRRWLNQRSPLFHQRAKLLYDGGRRVDTEEEKLVLFTVQ